MEKRVNYLKIFAEETDVKLQSNLPKDKYKRLINLIRANSPWTSLGINTMEEYRSHDKKIKVAKEIVGLYNEAGIEEKQWHIHWEYNRLDQREIRKSYKSMSRPPRQDNKTYLNTSPAWGSSNKNKIRYPRKARKTAWKRFYKLFPHLNPENEKET